MPSRIAIETKSTMFNTNPYFFSKKKKNANPYFIIHPSNIISENMVVITIIKECEYPTH